MTYVSTEGLARKPRWTPEQAVKWALSNVRDPYEYWSWKCDHFVTMCYGFYGSGHYSANEHWNSIPSVFKHRQSTPPPGALVFWDVSTFGHVAITTSVGYVASNDIKRVGFIDVVPTAYIANQWGAHYRGWTNPWFGQAWGINSDTPPNISQPTVSLSKIRHAATTPKHEQYPGGTLRVQQALKSEGLLEKFSRGTYGERTRHAYSVWQHKLGYSGSNANGVPGEASLAELGNKHGFDVRA